VQKSLDERRLADAHLALSKMYGNPDLPPERHSVQFVSFIANSEAPSELNQVMAVLK